jgi:hypothetical protein
MRCWREADREPFAAVEADREQMQFFPATDGRSHERNNGGALPASLRAAWPAGFATPTARQGGFSVLTEDG